MTTLRPATDAVAEAADRERRWFARKLHDGPCQSVNAARLFARAALKRLGSTHPETVVVLEELDAVLQDCSRDVQNVLGWLSAGELHQRSLAAALADLGAMVAKTLPCAVETAGGEGAFPCTDDDGYLLGLARDVLFDVVERGTAECVSLSLKVSECGVMLEIDERCATPGDGARDVLLQNRARVLGASLEIERQQGRGTRVRCHVPCTTTVVAGAAFEPDSNANGSVIPPITDDLAQQEQGFARHPWPLDEGVGLRVALVQLAAEWGRNAGLSMKLETVGFECGAAPRFPMHVERVLYRVVQEALANAAAHAYPSTLSVVVSRQGEFAVATVGDTGRGFDPTVAREERGLLRIREFVEKAGGELELHSRVGQGTTVLARIPLRVGQNPGAS